MPVDRSNYYHPSFLPLRDKIRERGAYSPFAYVQFQTQEGHGHHLMVGDGGDNLLAMGDSVEDIGEQLVAALAACSETKHKGHGRTHDPGQFRAAFAEAMDQLMSTPYDTDYLYQRWLEAMHKKWGGHIPAAVIMPGTSKVSLMVIGRPCSGPQFSPAARAASAARARSRAASRSWKIAPHVKVGISRTATVSGKRTAELVS